MQYVEAMASIRRNGRRVVTRPDGPRVAWRFGREVLLTGSSGFIDYTPTRDDMTAGDWQVEQ
jgi:hypothetical protein